ncbi:Na+/H+ antiporter NhaC family protein [Engelhardtia mirabilis]|uniref:Malate-2H(+)/Na(+)-lactate antiporter n=1 Tax=Engelhardtia mirabilis TaxID=2528011 RepID=A0A518BJY5_9BACT|nr:Malate-2H(+)/Na(+)-lactate antiporter [Planctomycetes bacterium Pla133]QDV01616.1 Malate-2H(+)/Na(+)-lactate antiporter [Planctomycetes bacterium Pla86]
MLRPGPAALTLAALAIVAALLFSGGPDPARAARLAALEANLLVSEGSWTNSAAESSGAESELLLAPALLDGPHVTATAEGQATLRLGTIQLALGGGEASDRELEPLARRSIVMGLRSFAEAERHLSLSVDGEQEAVPGGAALSLRRVDGGLELSYRPSPSEDSSLDAFRPWTPPGSRSLLPPVLAILLAIVTRRPLLSLGVGILGGSILVQLHRGANLLPALGQGAIDVPTVYLWDRLVSANDLYIVIFVVLMLAMVGNLTRNGGIRGLMNSLRRLAKDARTTQIATWLMGLAVFFDDYANTVLVGSTMRPLTDRFRVAREKLAYIVDSTAAPVAGLSIFSTWIAFEVGTFAAQLPAAGLLTTDGYQVFLQTLPYRFYCILTLIMVAVIVFTGRDFGPMLAAEVRARTTGRVIREGGTPMVSDSATNLEPAAGVVPAAWRAVLPLLGFVGTTLYVIASFGGAFEMSAGEFFTLTGITQVLYDGSGNKPLAIGSAVGFGLAALGTVTANLGIGEVLRAAWNTFKSMGVALGILYSAWMIGDVCGALGTQPYLTALVESAMPAWLLPVALLLLAGFTAFATGSSWSTMGILLPLVVGLSYRLGADLPIGSMGLMFLSIGAVLEGAIFGDHCSPISDTTVLSSIASASDHIDHVRTQAPYALTVMGVSITCGYLPCAYFGMSPWISLVLSATALYAIMRLLGKKVDEAPTPAEPAPAT